MNIFFGIVKNNKLYIVLLIFIIFVNAVMLLDKAGEGKIETASQNMESSQKVGIGLFVEQDINVRKEKIERLAFEKPLLYLFLAMFNLMIFFVIFVGILLDIYFLRRFFKKIQVKIRIMPQLFPRWKFSDIFRVIIVFTSFGYLFMILEGFAVKFPPIFYNDNFRMVFNTALVNIAGISVVVYFVTKKYGHGIREIGITFKNFFPGIFYAIVGYAAIIPVVTAILIITFFVTKLIGYQAPTQEIVQVFIREKSAGVLGLSACFAAVFGPIAEEIFFRGFVYPAVRERIGVFWAVASTSIIFSFLHTHIVGFLPIMVLGLLLAYLYEKTGSLIPSIMVHVMHNLSMVILVFLVRYSGI